MAGIKLTFIECDLTSLTSIEVAARQFISASPRLDVLMCNAGIMASPLGLTQDGYELQFGTNYVSHALLVKLLLPKLLQTAKEPSSDVRIIFLTSTGFRQHPVDGIVFKDLRTTQDFGIGGSWMRYGQSSLANILYPAELARRYPTITSVSIHPGVIATGLVGNLTFAKKTLVYLAHLGQVKDPATGAWNQLWAVAVDKDKIVNGGFYEPVAIPGDHDNLSNNHELAAKLWEWTEKELEKYKV